MTSARRAGMASAATATVAVAGQPAAQATGSIVQLAASSRLVESDEAHQSAGLKLRSQRLKEEIDRLKSSIPVSAIVRQQSEIRELKTTTTTTTTTSRKQAFRQLRELRDSGAPLASLDCSITIGGGGGSSRVQADQINNNNNNSCASLDDTTASSGLSGYFECDELSDMVDDSLFELTNAGCLSRSVFPREDKMSTSRGAANLLEEEQEEEEEKWGEPRTPANQERAMISGDGPAGRVGQQHHSGPQVVAFSPRSDSLIQSHNIRTTAIPHPIITTTTTNNTTIASSSTSSSSSLVAQDQQRGDNKIISERKPQLAVRSDRHRRQVTKERKASYCGSHISSSQPGESTKIAASGSHSDQTEQDSPIRERLVHGEEPQGRRPRRAEKKVDVTTKRAARSQAPVGRRATRSQSNSMLAEGNNTTAKTMTTTTRQKAVNSRCPICCCEQATGPANHNNKKPAGARKRRFTFSLFNLFTGGNGGARRDNGADIDGDDEMSPARSRHLAACQHHDDLASAQDSIRFATAAPAPSSRGRRTGGARQSAAGGPSKRGVSKAAPINPLVDRPLLPLRLRDSIKITNQRKARHQQSNQSNQQATPRGVAATRVSGNGYASSSHSNTSELLLDLSTNGGAGGNNTSEPTPAPSGPIRSKCVKFTTPDRVLIVSPTPAGELGGSGSGGGGATTPRRPLAARIPASASVTAGLSVGSPTSIIKRSTTSTSTTTVGVGGVRKSSSYSQTEPNKGLDELLARYEHDASLVAAINEKLHLTDRIESNRVALDSVESQGGGGGGRQGRPGERAADDIGHLVQPLEVARQQQKQQQQHQRQHQHQQELAARSSRSIYTDGQQTRAANSGDGEGQREDFSRCDCLSGREITTKRRAPDLCEIKCADCGDGGGGDDDNEPIESKLTLSAPATSSTSDRAKLISDLTRRAAGALEGDMQAEENSNQVNGAADADLNAHNNQIYEPRQGQHRRRADTTSSGTRRARTFVAAEARHSSSLDQVAAARHHRSPAAAQEEPPCEISREWLGKQTRAFV